jgi:hypothetical protein
MTTTMPSSEGSVQVWSFARVAPRFATDRPAAGHPLTQGIRRVVACHERILRLPLGKRKMSRMVEAAGVEFEISGFRNLLMARDF